MRFATARLSFKPMCRRMSNCGLRLSAGRSLRPRSTPQQTNHTRVNWRRYDHHQTPYREHRLPRDVAQRCVQLVERLGLCYGAIDMVLTPDGRYVFLEINPNGQYQWIEDFTGLPISDAICDLLTFGSPALKPADHTIDLNLRGPR